MYWPHGQSFNRDKEIEEQIIWYNSLIRVNDEPIFWEKPYNKGLKHVDQRFQNNQLIKGLHFRIEYHDIMLNK